MEPLKDHILFYDDDCPACNVYSDLFIKSNMLDKDGRKPFREVNNDKYKSINRDKARNEIALYNTNNNKVYYGIDSLFEIIGNSFGLFKYLFRNRVFRWLCAQLYFFISYNRKVIAPGKTFELKQECRPDMHFGYRIAYIVAIRIFTSIVLTFYSETIYPLLDKSNIAREFLICGGQILFQGIVIWYTDKEKTIYYLGNMMTISGIGALILLPFLLIFKILSFPYLYLAIFGMVVFIMTILHIRRVKVLELPFYMTITWIIYRLLILGVIL